MVIECQKCKKTVDRAKWVHSVANFTRTPYCTECFEKVVKEIENEKR